MYIYYLANRDYEINEIFAEYNQLHETEFPAHDLEDVIENIDTIQAQKNVQMTNQLTKVFDNFKYSVLD